MSSKRYSIGLSHILVMDRIKYKYQSEIESRKSRL